VNIRSKLKDALEALLSDFETLSEACKADNESVLRFGTLYQEWYTKGLKIVGALAPDRHSEFLELYEGSGERKTLGETDYLIRDFVRGIAIFKTNTKKQLMFDVAEVTKVRLLNQWQILYSLRSRIDGVLADVEGALLASVEDGELAAAEQLVEVSPRAAGSLAGVILERHLQRAAENHQLALTKQPPTISDLNDALRSVGVYDLPPWRKIQHLADVRNLCSHPKDREPTREEVLDLIAGVKSVVANIV